MVRRFILAAAVTAAAVFGSHPVVGGIIRTQRAMAAKFPTQAYGYIPINAQYDSAMFYGIRGDDSKSEAERAAMPLVMWLQGGPGATSQFGDLLESGPLKLSIANNSAGYSLGTREHTWVRRANMLYVDNPVGTGFSYTNNTAGFATTDDQIAADLVVFLRGFLQKHTEFQQKDFWVFCESYGGKMTAYFGAALIDAKLPINFKGVALGDGWVDPLSCMNSYAPYLTTFSQISPAEAAQVTSVAQMATAAWKGGNGTLATNLWSAQQDMIQLFTNNLNWYNSLYYYDYTADNQLDVYLNSTAFNQLLMFHGVRLPEGFYYNKQSNDVFNYMSGHFMDNGTAQVLKMLEAGLDVNVYGGQLDLIVDTLCIQGWLYNLPWAGMDKFKSVDSRSPLVSHDSQQTMYGFVQSYQNLHFWQINGAGHMVPLDQPAAAFRMFEDMLSGSSTSARRSSKDIPRQPVNRRKRLV